MFNHSQRMAEQISEDGSISKLSSFWDYTVAAYSMSIATSSLCLNGLLLGVSYLKKKKMRIIDCLLVNLAVTDIGLAISVFPLFIYSSINHRWSFGETGCWYFAFMSFSLGVASMMSLTEIAFIRYQMVCRSTSSSRVLQCPGYSSIERLFLLTFPYLHGAMWALGPFFGWGKYDYTPYGTACSLSWDMQHLPYLICSCIFCLAVPVAVMAFSYFKITQKKNRSTRSLGHSSPSSARSPRLTMKTLSMCIAFVMAWTPYALVGILSMIIPVKQFPMPMFVLPSLCAKSSVTTNPILHAALSSNYRNDVKNLFLHIRGPLCCQESKGNKTHVLSSEVSQCGYDQSTSV